MRLSGAQSGMTSHSVDASTPPPSPDPANTGVKKLSRAGSHSPTQAKTDQAMDEASDDWGAGNGEAVRHEGKTQRRKEAEERQGVGDEDQHRDAE